MSNRDEAERCLQALYDRAFTLAPEHLLQAALVNATLALSEPPPGLDVEQVAGWLGSLDADELERDALEREDAYLGGTRAILAQLQDYVRAGLSGA